MTHLQLLIRAAPTPREHLRNIELAARSDAKQHLQIHGGSTPSTDLARIFFYRPPVLLIESIESIRLAYIFHISTQPLESEMDISKFGELLSSFMCSCFVSSPLPDLDLRIPVCIRFILLWL